MNPKVGVLLINLGTPDSPSVGDVRKYLFEFLNDPRVIDISAISRFFLVNFIIVPFRAPKSAKIYKDLWTKDGSPILIYGRSIKEKLQLALGDDFKVHLAMRYQNPSMDNILAKMEKNNKEMENLKKKDIKKGKKSMIRELLETVISAGIIAFIIITFIGQVTVVRGASMEPTLHDNERLIANKISYRFETPERGEIIIFKPPLEIKRNYIKRIIGVPGDKIEITEGEIYLNDKKLEEPYVKNRSYENMPPTIVPDNSFFVLGDNRPNSSDSRYWGFVPRKNVVGRAWVVFWPLNKIRLP